MKVVCYDETKENVLESDTDISLRHLYWLVLDSYLTVKVHSRCLIGHLKIS